MYIIQYVYYVYNIYNAVWCQVYLVFPKDFAYFMDEKFKVKGKQSFLGIR